MMNKVASGFAFILGLGIGSFITYKYVKDIYENIAQEEIDSVKEAYAEKVKALNNDISIEEKKKKANDAKNKPDISEYVAKIKENGYTNYSNISQEEDEVKRPYIISPEEYGDDEEYETLSFTYYSDGVLTDENDEVITHPESLVGSDYESHFGEYEDDSVFVRNEDRKVDVEILMDYRTYQEVLGNNPHLEG